MKTIAVVGLLLASIASMFAGPRSMAGSPAVDAVECVTQGCKKGSDVLKNTCAGFACVIIQFNDHPAFSTDGACFCDEEAPGDEACQEDYACSVVWDITAKV